MFALATKAEQENSNSSKVMIYLINGVTGKVVQQFYEKNVVLSEVNDIAILFNENYFAMAFHRMNQQTGLSQQELTVVEIFANRQENDTLKLIKDYYKGDKRITASEFSSYDMGTPLIVQETYILPLNIKSIALTDTVNHVSSKSMILITTSNQVY